MNALRPYSMFRVEWMQYVSILCLGLKECTTFIHIVQGRMNVLCSYAMFRVEWMHYIPIECLG